ncbi:Protein HGH1 homolog [Eumeta japonica]|uniref:Protein HGH1 homolog n=1 Tax=Eumeta variegata TaxID=151549 RepID=A0A4C1VLN4_EUMVA|nr:Protein HGH1 homolog [Eumeta japonica]
MSENKDPLSEIVQFLNLDSRLDLKIIALDHVVGLSASREGVEALLKNGVILTKIIDLLDDKNNDIAKNATVLLVNVTASESGAKDVLKYKPSDHKDVLELLISVVMNPQKVNADAACMMLSNVTRLEDELDACIDVILPHLNDIINIFVNTDFNKKGCKLHYLAPMLSNLSRSKTTMYARVKPRAKTVYNINYRVVEPFLLFCE